MRYRITDANGLSDDGQLTATVTAIGSNDVVSTDQNVAAAVDLLANDTPGHNADGSIGTIDRTSARFSLTGQPDSAIVSADRRVLTVPLVGVYTIDPATGVLTFDPDPAYVGPADLLGYDAQDTTMAADGSIEHHGYTAYLYSSTGATNIRVGADIVATPFNTAVRIPGVTNDHSTDPTVALRPELSGIVPGPTQLPPGSTLSADRRNLTWAGVGSYTFNADGSVAFSPVPGYVGRKAIDYDVYDVTGRRAFGSLDVTVEPGPHATPDAGTTPQNVTKAFDVLGNDVPGVDGNRHPGTTDPTYVRFPSAGQPNGAVVSSYQRTLTVPGQGVYTVDPTTGTISFDPEASFVGTAGPVAYKTRDTVVDRTGAVVHNPTSSTLTIAVGALTPVALNNWSNTTVGRAVAVPVLGNDRPGAASAPLVPSSVRLRLGSGLPSSSTLSADGRTLTIPGRGTYAARADGVVVVTPAAGFAGVVPTVGYTVSDTNGTSASATVTVGVARASS